MSAKSTASRRIVLASLALSVPVLASVQGCATGSGSAQTPAGAPARDPELEASADAALQQLLAQNDGARALARNATSILTFPKIMRGGLVIGAQHGKGVLKTGGQVAGYYESTGLSYGLQAGVQEYAFALFFMSDEALDYLRRSGGWEIGTGPTVVVADEGISRQLSTTTMREGIYAFIWEQRGLMAGIGLQGTRITPAR